MYRIEINRRRKPSIDFKRKDQSMPSFNETQHMNQLKDFTLKG